MKNWTEFIFSDQPFENKALKIFEFQFEHNIIYRRFCEAWGGKEILEEVQDDINRIPLLPIRAFRDTDIFTTGEHSTFNIQAPSLIFKSSGTGGMDSSTHLVADEEIYRQSLLKGFKEFYDLDNAVFLGYTPGYIENPHSSLIWMINELIRQDEIKKSRFLPLDQPLSQGEVDDIAASGKQLILFGAAFGLLDLAERSSVDLPPDSVVMETGGMKTHRREMSRYEMHQILARGFGVHISRIHSEYGMCELLSQAYATGGKWFRSTSGVKFSVRNPDDPRRRAPAFREGLIGAIDLANVYSCSFILTGDRGMLDRNGRLQVLGRWNTSDLRGCNFLINED